ncbi:MAG: hypothetical protein KDA32_11375 [Phycisphaerales bacterium]|nr:hypothetical protein [Phycisphaerales bacterium]
MPEAPDIELYLHALHPRIVGRELVRVHINSPFVLQTFDPPIDAAEGKAVARLSRLGKRIVITLADECHIVLHLMIAGRLRWADTVDEEATESAKPKRPARPPRGGLAVFAFDSGTLTFTEAGTKHRAKLFFVEGEHGLLPHRPRGVDAMNCELAEFRDALCAENHTLKRSLTDQRLIQGVGNAYSDEILHRARLSPLARTKSLDDAQIESLWGATRETLRDWRDRLIARFGDRFPGPGQVTAFRPDFAVHGRYGQACPVCGDPVQRIRYAENEVNYCPTCQTGGKVLADRSLSRLLKDDWPRTLDEWEAMELGPRE